MHDKIRPGRATRALAGPLLLALFVAVALAACGSDDDESATGGGELVVSAAASLKQSFQTYGERFEGAEAQFSFAGSDELATQIRAGAKPDVFASANTKLPEELHREGLVERPVVFAANRLVLAVSSDANEVRSIDDLTKPGVALAIGAADVPVGSYTRKVLAGLDASAERRILANVRTEEPDVTGIAAKLTQGAADAGFLYITDVEATNGRLKAIELPAGLRPQVAYGVAVVKGARNADAARAFIDGLLDGAGADALRDAGFEPPPS